jgi:hypothetical protein
VKRNMSILKTVAVAAMSIAMIVPVKAETRDALVGEWCLVETKINSRCLRNEVLTILPTKIIVWSVAPGSYPVELKIESFRQKRPNTWEVGFGEDFKETWSLSKTLLITHDGRGHTHTYVRRTKEGD